MRKPSWILMVVWLASCSDAPSSRIHDGEETLSPSQQLAVEGLRTYCGACHGLGELNFLDSESDQEVWDQLFAKTAPNSGTVWAEEIRNVLSWPTDVPPDFEDPIAPGRDWMPKGVKRLELAEDSVEGYPMRHLILDEINARLQSEGSQLD